MFARYQKAAGPLQNHFTQILLKGYQAGQLPVYSAEARTWYREHAKLVSNINESTLMKSEPERFKNQVVPGRMYMFYYDPKLKKKLPYYDTLPLVFPISMDSSSFLGLNMHYLPHDLRAKLMDALYPYLNNLELDYTTRLQISFRILKSVSRLAPYRPCVKRYLKAHVRSRFVMIDVKEWDIALFLPLERFEKASARHVWAESRNAISSFNAAKPGRNVRGRR